MRWLLLAIVLQLSRCIAAQQRISEGPSETLALIGSTVELRCKVEHQKGSVQWMKNGLGLGVDRGLKFFPRYSMVGSAAQGEYHLQIVNVTVQDDDVYICHISEAATEPSVRSNPAKLTVLMRPSAPRLLLRPTNHILPAIAGEPVLQSCVSKKGKPPPRLGWVIANDPEGKRIETWLGESRSKFGHLYKTSGLTQESVSALVEESIQKEGQLFSVISNISYVPRPEDDRRYLLCLSQHETFPERVESESLRLTLQYAPRVNLTIASQHKLREGGSALLACNVDAKPLDNLKIAWFRNGQQLRHTTDTLTFEELKMEDHRAEYTCQATNAIGTSRGAINLNVAFGPRMVTTPQEKEVNGGEASSFTCESTGNPAPALFWSKAGDDQVIGKGESFSIPAVHSWQQGEYICTAVVEGFRHAKVSHYLHIRGPPAVTVSDEKSGTFGESVEISCKVSGRPKPPEIVWTKNGEELNYNSGRLQVHQIPRAYGVESRLTIREMRDTDIGMYNCSANNGLGSDSKGTKLRKKGIVDSIHELQDNPEIMMIAPILAGILLLTCCLCCCVVRRRRRYSGKGSKFTASESDVTVKCEALDGQYFPEMYSSPLDDGNIITSKDYISIPQNNPDLDLLVPSSYGLSTSNGSLYQKYLNNSVNEYNCMQTRYEPSYGSFASGISTPGGLSEMYGLPDKGCAPLETLQEVDTPKVSTYSFMAPETRPLSRTSTHV